jgi:hypothetical protein
MRAIQILAVGLFAVCVALPAHAQDKQSQSTTQQVAKKKVVAKNKPSEISEERKTKILSFVNEHHPELTGLLEQLKKGKKKRPWLSAMNGLNKAIKKLEGIKERNPDRYETALKQWKLESRIQVASAHLKHKNTEEGREKLESLIGKLVDFHIDRLKKDRDQVQNRLKQLEKKVTDAESNREQLIEKRLKASLPKVKKEKKEKAN